jgi:hypothetical protein
MTYSFHDHIDLTFTYFYLIEFKDGIITHNKNLIYTLLHRPDYLNVFSLLPHLSFPPLLPYVKWG